MGFYGLPCELQEYIRDLACINSYNDVLNDIRKNVKHTLVWDNGGVGDDHLELNELELERRGLLEEAKQHWSITTNLYVVHLDMDVTYWYDPHAFHKRTIPCEWRGFLGTLYCWSGAPYHEREVQVVSYPKADQVVVNVSTWPV